MNLIPRRFRTSTATIVSPVDGSHEATVNVLAPTWASELRVIRCALAEFRHDNWKVEDVMKTSTANGDGRSLWRVYCVRVPE